MTNGSIPETGFSGLKAHFKEDIVSGFSVSLIALPLCLGIAIASGLPPLAGLITAIIGGLLGSRISGTYVTISGPAAGLIVVILGASEELGGAGLAHGYAGYPHTLGAIVIAGVIMALFGLLKVGKLGDYFPTAAVHGMLAAIGMIIIIKQYFPAIGMHSPPGSILEVATEIIPSFANINPYAGAISLATLFILVVHPRIKVKFVKVIPAPMWVMIITIGMSQFFGTDHLELVSMPHHLFGADGITAPDFTKIGEGVFWSAVVTIALVAAIESLLSAKAVDALDPYQRKSNLNRDLFAMGASSSVAALIGGLPMISEIVRSSANVNNGGKTQWANFFHGLFLLIFLLFATSIIELIPLSALAAMLVFTGYRLASPKEFAHMYSIGRTEIIVFITTLLAVLATDLIIGIAIGILCNYIILLVDGAEASALFKVHVKTQKNGDSTHLVLNKSVLFSNYLGLKKHIENALEESSQVVIDFANVTLVDHSTLVHLETLKKLAVSEGKTIETSGLDALVAASSHPRAQRRRNNG